MIAKTRREMAGPAARNARDDVEVDDQSITTGGNKLDAKKTAHDIMHITYARRNTTRERRRTTQF